LKPESVLQRRSENHRRVQRHDGEFNL
jgi:hypothetical protein